MAASVWRRAESLAGSPGWSLVSRGCGVCRGGGPGDGGDSVGVAGNEGRGVGDGDTVRGGRQGTLDVVEFRVEIAGAVDGDEDNVFHGEAGEAFVVASAFETVQKFERVGLERFRDAGDVGLGEDDAGRVNFEVDGELRVIVGGLDDFVGEGGGDAFGGEHLLEGGLDVVRKGSGVGGYATVERDVRVDAGGELFGGEPDEVFEAGGEELVERDGLEADDEAATHAGAGVVDGGVGEEAGVEQALGGVAEGVGVEHLAGLEAGGGEQLGGGVGAGVPEGDAGDGVLGMRRRGRAECGEEKQGG
jgi:hypothetical protein